MLHVEAVNNYSFSMKPESRADIDTTPSSTSSLPLTQGNPHKCSQRGCERQFNRKYTLVEHMKTHTGEKPHVCPVQSCRKRFSTSGNFSRHKRLHGIIKPLECPVEGCYCMFPSDNKLNKHMQFHLGNPVHVCTIGNCGKTFSTTGNLNRHAKRHHPNDTLRPIPPQLATSLPVQALQQLHVQISPQEQVPYSVDVRYQLPSPRVIDPPMMDVAPTAFSPRLGQQYYGGQWNSDFSRPNSGQMMPSQVPSPIGVIPQGTRNLGIADVPSFIFDEMEYVSMDIEKPLPTPLLQPQNPLDDIKDFHVAHIEL